MKINPRLIIGLGNPGKEYEKTYHNVGFLAVDFFAENPPIFNFPACTEASAGRQFPISKLLKSDAYMNQSGNFVKAALKKYKIKPEEILIVHDDSDIELGKYKFSFNRGSAGHRGIQSIIDSLKTKNFWRLRIGIRQATNDKRQATNDKQQATSNKRQATRRKASELVLKKINKENLKILEKLFSEINI